MNTQVTIWLNVEAERDAEGHVTSAPGFLGYQSGQAVCPVFTYVTHELPLLELDRAFAMFNSYPEEMHSAIETLPTVAAYRALRLRSLSVGDLVQVGQRFWACGGTGWKSLGRPGLDSNPLNIQPNSFDNFAQPK